MERDIVEVRRDVSWAELTRYLRRKGEKRIPRIKYLDGVLELVTPSHSHERHGAWIGAMIAVYALERGVELSSFRSWALKDKLRKAGAEPDDCYILGPKVDETMRPDLVIEIQWSRSAVKKLDIYARLGIREVWLWRAPATIDVHGLAGTTYRKRSRSTCLPDLDLPQLCSFLDRPTMSQAMRDYRAALTTG